jgi:hypothetical protein
VVKLSDYATYLRNGSKGVLPQVSITPIGCFAAPSTFDARIGKTELSCPDPIQNAHVDESDKSFRSRTLVIRYRDEIHELNDGVHWRLTSTKAKLSALPDGSVPYYEHLLLFNMELMFAELLKDDSIDEMDEVEKLFPTNPIFTSIASQTLCFQRFGSGIHEYYPASFGRMNFVHLDCMIHSGAVGINYRMIDAPWVYMSKSNENEYEILEDLSGDSFVSVSRKYSKVSEFDPILPTEVNSSKGLYCCSLNDIGVGKFDPNVDLLTDIGSIYTKTMEGNNFWDVIFPTTASYSPDVSPPRRAAERMQSISMKRKNVPIPLKEQPSFKIVDSSVSEDKKEADPSSSLTLTPQREHPIDTPDTSPILERDVLVNLDYVTHQAYIVHDLNDSFSSQPNHPSPQLQYGSPAKIVRSSFFADSPKKSLSMSSATAFSSTSTNATAAAGYYKPTSLSRSNSISKDADFVIYEILEDEIPFTEAEINDLFDLKTKIAILNYEALRDHVLELLHITELSIIVKAQKAEKISSFVEKYSKERDLDFQGFCCLSLLRQETITMMLSCQTKTDALVALDRLMVEYNLELTSLWSEFLSSIRMAMPVIREVLKYEYDLKMRQYWKRQVLIQTCRYSIQPSFCYSLIDLMVDDALVRTICEDLILMRAH